MKKIKRILAMIGIVLLAGLYLSTLVLAVFDSSNTMSLFRASVYATIIIPVLIWIYSFIYKLVHKKDDASAASFPADSHTEGAGSSIAAGSHTEEAGSSPPTKELFKNNL